MVELMRKSEEGGCGGARRGPGRTGGSGGGPFDGTPCLGECWSNSMLPQYKI